MRIQWSSVSAVCLPSEGHGNVPSLTMAVLAYIVGVPGGRPLTRRLLSQKRSTSQQRVWTLPVTTSWGHSSFGSHPYMCGDSPQRGSGFDGTPLGEIKSGHSASRHQKEV